MQMISKTVKGQKYWYLVEKGRKNGVVTNVKTIYLGKADRVAQMLADPGATEAAFPSAFQSREMGASAALWMEAQAIGLVETMDRVCPGRRSDATWSYGALLVTASIQRAIAPRALKSSEQLRAWYEGCGLADLLALESSGLDARRVDEALSQLSAPDIDAMEQEVMANVVRIHRLAMTTVAFDTTNFDSYAGAHNPSRLLKRGHAKSKRAGLRVLGLGLLATKDDGVPLLSFVYPGNRVDVTAFRSFLRRLKQRRRKLGVDKETTVVCDGGNLSEQVVKELERDNQHFVARLPTGHAPEADALATADLPPLSGRLTAVGRARKLTTLVYGKMRTVVAVYSKSMHLSQLPGLLRDRRTATAALDALQERLERQRHGQGNQRHWLTQASLRKRVQDALARQHMSDLFPVEIGGTPAAPTLLYRFDDVAWHRIETHRLGRTAILTDRDGWSCQQLVEELREQSHVEEAFRQLKDPEWASAVPLRHWTDPMLRVHAFIAVLSLLLSRLVVRRLRRAKIHATASEALWELSQLRLARLHYGPTASPQLHALAKKQEVPPATTPRQQQMIRALGLESTLELGPT